MNIKRFLDRYTGLSERTKAAYKETLVNLDAFVGGGEPTDDDVRNYLSRYTNGKTIQRHKAAIKRYYLMKGRTWSFDPREFPPAKKALPKYLSDRDIQSLVSVCQDESESMFIETLFNTGLRIAELKSLERDNIEPDRIRVIGKGNKERLVPSIDDEFMRRLRKYASSCSGKLFPETYEYYYLLLRRLCQFAGVEVVSPHKIRHSIAVSLIKRGMTLDGVRLFLGHENVATTLIYTSITQDDLKKQIAGLKPVH